MENTEEVLEREKEFHDNWASEINPESLNVESFFESSTAPENRFILTQLGNVKGKTLLDIGCGAGENSVYFAKKGAICTATDYSSGMVEVAKKFAKKNNVIIDARVMNAMNMDCPDNTFDIAYASNILHHVDPEVTIKEMHRVLKPGGKVCFWDPLKHNPIINVYRKIATKVRTEDEHPLDINIVQYAQSLFKEVNYDTFWICSLWIFLQFYLIERVDPNKERYWKKIISEEKRLRNQYLFLEKLDNIVKLIPFMKRFAWNIAVVATK